jgi:hypothetical protein
VAGRGLLEQRPTVRSDAQASFGCFDESVQMRLSFLPSSGEEVAQQAEVKKEKL